jgi:hypothetical protein
MRIPFPHHPEEHSMTRKLSLTVFAATQCIFAALVATAPAQAADSIPSYFFSQWTVKSNCTEANAGPATRVQAGLKFKISNDSTDGTYTLQAINTDGKQWASEWNGVKLRYRAGGKMTTVPADFECVAGSEESSASASPLLAMSGYVQTAEPQYSFEHYYGLVTIHGQPEHVLIFPRGAKGGTSAIIVLESASTSSNVNLDDNGVINSN